MVQADVSFGWEPVDQLLKEAGTQDIIKAMWEELGPLKEGVPLDVDYARKSALEKGGAYRVWVARKDGVIAGFIEFQLVNHLNYKSTLFAFDQGHYLSPAYRGKDWAGIKMWESACDALRQLGVKVVIAHDNAVLPLNAFFARMGFSLRGALFAKVL